MNEIGRPYIPEEITVHLGPPGANVDNVTVSFRDYIKNVASSEIYPTWEEQAIRANILAQISFALNKIYLEYYPSRGYNFDITSSTAYDQKFTPGRDIFENVAAIVDELFQSYVRRQGNIEPLSTSFCNGTTVTCAGLSQWGSQSLAQEGRDYLEILKYYYGDDIEIVTNAPVRTITPSYPGTPLRLGSSGESVLLIQGALNRISRNYPAIPKINPLDGLFGEGTERAVKEFQRIFDLTPDGIVGASTWYEIISIYVAVTRLAELKSEGQKYVTQSFDLPSVLSLGSTGNDVYGLQYMLSVLSKFIPEIPDVAQDGQYGIATRDAVVAYQRFAGLPVSGAVGVKTWDSIYNRFSGVSDVVLNNQTLFPNQGAAATVQTIADVQRTLRKAAPVFAAIEKPRVTGVMDRTTTRAIAKLQNQMGQRPTGQITPAVRRYLGIIAYGEAVGNAVRHRQYPGYALYPGIRDHGGNKV